MSVKYTFYNSYVFLKSDLLRVSHILIETFFDVLKFKIFIKTSPQFVM